MNNRVPIPHGLLRVGAGLSHDVYDRAGRLLLRRGTPLDSEARIEHLESAGFFDPEAVDALKEAKDAQDKSVVIGYVPSYSGRPVSVFAELTAACERLQALFAADEGDTDRGIRAIGATIARCCTIDSDAAIAVLHLPLPFPYNVRHPVNVATLVNLVLARQKHDEARRQSAIAAALTMNLGALDLHHELYYQPETLNDEQRSRIRAHPGAGVEALLARAVRDPLWLAVVSQHHEAIDGSGYPSGLAGDRILPEAQVVSLADRFCAMVSERAQREPMVPTVALKEILARHGKAVTPELIRNLVNAMGLYPPGTFVRLANGETAVAVRRLLDPKHPVVFSLAGPSGNPYDAPRKRLTASNPQFAIQAPVPRKEVKASVVAEDLWPPSLAPVEAAPAGEPAHRS
jgi:hypothetical protein